MTRTAPSTRTAVLSTAVAVAGTGSLLLVGNVLKPNVGESLPAYFIYQAVALAIAGVVVVAMRLVTGSWPTLLGRGKPSAPSRAVRLLGVAEGESWRRVGTTFVVIVSAVTATYLGLTYWSTGLAAVPPTGWLFAIGLAIPLSVSNAFIEELITRWTVAEGFGTVGALARYAPWASALIFGGVHYFGVPAGIVGSIMAGFLAWFSTRSIQDTGGIWWAWSIHFVQDILIFSVLLTRFFV